MLEETNRAILAEWKVAYGNKPCLMLGAGPSLAGFSPKKLAELAEDKVVFAIKQAYLRCPSLVDFHFFNDNNFTPVTYDRTKCKVVACLPANHRPPVLEQMADFICLVGQNWEFHESLSGSHKFSDWTLEKSPLVRPWGPGITYEIVFYMAHYLGCPSIETIGWDLGPKGSLSRSHFYDGVKPALVNPAAPLDKNEAQKEISLTAAFNSWLLSEGISLKILHHGSYADESIPRKIV